MSPGSSFLLRNNLRGTSDPHVTPTEIQATSSNPKQLPQEPQPTSQTASSEVSWMSLAVEKTKSLQQLFTSRFPRDLTAMQTAARPQAQTEALNAAQEQTQAVKSMASVQTANRPSADTKKTETLQSTSPTQSVKPAQMAAQQRTSTSTGRESQTQSASHQPLQTSLRSTQSPLHSSKQTEPSSTFVQGCAPQLLAQSGLSSGQHDAQQISPWGSRSLQRTNQLKPTTPVSTVPATTASSPVEKQEKDSSLSRRRAVWGGSVGEKAAFLEKQAPGTKGVCGTSL